MRDVTNLLMIGINLSIFLILEILPVEYGELYFISILSLMTFSSLSILVVSLGLSKGLKFRIIYLLINSLFTLFFIFYLILMYFFFNGTFGSH